MGMGSFCSCWNMHPRTISLLLVGLDNAGKTTAIKGLAGEPTDHTVPTIGFSCTVIQAKRSQVKVYDLGGLPNIRGIWDKYFADVHGVIYVVDASQIDRLEESKAELEKLISHEKIKGKPVLLLANKQDLPGALDELDLVDRLNLEYLVNAYKCPTTVETCAAILSPDPAVQSGFNWLVDAIIKDFTVLDSRVSADVAAQQAEQARLRLERQERVEKLRRERGAAEEDTAEDKGFDVSPFRPIEDIVSDINGGPKMILVQQSPPPSGTPKKEEQPLITSTNPEVEIPAVEETKKRSFLPLRSNKTAPAAEGSPVRKQTTSLPPIKQKSPVPGEPSVPWIKPVLSANGERNGSAGRDNAWDLDQSLDVIQLADVKNGTSKHKVTELHRPKFHNGH
ncbi:ADP-ribosylation factor-like protein 13B [Neocloeon triangulifer]|uniref:ADP-ribosylation factor-like protein 13B n=1 Tax=Neocloeon triangulifer TaxID=2078957 RepID=UPI00286EDA98|nr:ADP-ribosylation factor-like protein 13B [Neocloeon triangulifer]